MRKNIDLEIIKKAMFVKKMSQSELARKMGVTRQYVSKNFVDAKAGDKFINNLVTILELDKELILK